MRSSLAMLLASITAASSNEGAFFRDSVCGNVLSQSWHNFGRRLRNVPSSVMQGGVFKLCSGADLAPCVHGWREMDLLVDLETVFPAAQGEVHGVLVSDPVFPDFPSAALRPELWPFLCTSRFGRKEPVHVLEGWSTFSAIKHFTRDSRRHYRRVRVNADSMCCVLAFSKGRYASLPLLQVCRRGIWYTFESQSQSPLTLPPIFFFPAFGRDVEWEEETRDSAGSASSVRGGGRGSENIDNGGSDYKSCIDKEEACDDSRAQSVGSAGDGERGGASQPFSRFRPPRLGTIVLDKGRLLLRPRVCRRRVGLERHAEVHTERCFRNSGISQSPRGWGRCTTPSVLDKALCSDQTVVESRGFGTKLKAALELAHVDFLHEGKDLHARLSGPPRRLHLSRSERLRRKLTPWPGEPGCRSARNTRSSTASRDTCWHFGARR